MVADHASARKLVDAVGASAKQFLTDMHEALRAARGTSVTAKEITYWHDGDTLVSLRKVEVDVDDIAHALIKSITVYDECDRFIDIVPRHPPETTRVEVVFRSADPPAE